MNTGECRYCMREIDKRATRCPHCGSELDEAPYKVLVSIYKALVWLMAGFVLFDMIF